jgi:DNA polymerase elongation subunit (family B)
VTSPRVLTIDIETFPHQVYTWGLFDQNVALNQIVEPGRVACFAAKWLGEPKIIFKSEFHDGREAMLAAAHDLYDEADVVVTYNGKSFDNKHLFREMVLAGMGPPSPHHDIDLLAAVRSRFRMASNKLQHVAQQLGIGGKADTGGFDLWVQCMAGDSKAWAKMRRYNKQDVVLTEQLYERIKAWVPRHPNFALYGDDEIACPKCQSTDLQMRGSRVTGAGTYQRYFCNSCGAWARGSKRLSTTSLRET